MSFPLGVIDAFAAKPFHGNPAAVCLLPSAADPVWMQSVGVEMTLRGDRVTLHGPAVTVWRSELI